MSSVRAGREKLFYDGGPSNPDKNTPQYMIAVCNTQTLYDARTLRGVDSDGRKVFGFLNERMPFEIRYRGTVKSSDDAKRIVKETLEPGCIGLAGWFHTFHPGALSLNAYRNLSVPYINV